MSAERNPDVDDLTRTLRDRLIRERIAPSVRYAFFFTSGDGRLLPGTAVEESSGYVLDDAGRVHYFQFGWDAAAGVPALTQWETEEPSPSWERDAEYRRARERVGLV